jgi:glycine/D-amino acid oxidase-like deaminating enzyme
VAIIGGGVAGICAAYHLATAGVDVVVLERDVLGSGATGTSVGVLSPPLFQPFDQTVRFRGEEVARAVWEFASRSVKGLGALLETRGAAGRAGLDLAGGYVVADEESLGDMERDFAALEGAGLPVEWLSGERVREITGGDDFHGGYRIEGGGCLSPVPAVQAVAEATREAGGVILESVDVEDVRRLEGRLACDTRHGRLMTEMVVYATHVDVRRFSAFVGDEIVPIRGQAMMIETGAPVFRGAFSTHWKSNVWRSDPEGRLLIGGWRQEAWDRSYWKAKPRLDKKLQESILGWFRSSFPELERQPVARRWSGIYGWTADYLPLVGPLPGRPGEMVLSGFSGGGLSFAFEAARAIAAVVTEGETVPGAELFNPRRFT